MATQGKIRVYKRIAKKGITYTYSIEAGRDVNGKRKRVTKSGFKTQKEARAAAQPVLNKLLLGENIIESDITFNEYADKWLKEHSLGLKPNTILAIKNNLSSTKKYLGHLKMKDITLYKYQQFLNDIALKVKKSTITSINAYTKMVFKQAVQYGIILNNPTINSTLPKMQYEVTDISTLYLNKNELHQLITHVKSDLRNPFMYYLITTLVYTGMRIGEACALVWNDIDFKQKNIYIHSTMFDKGLNNYIKQDTPKTKSSIRKIIIDDILINILKEWKIKQLSIRLQNGTMNKRDKEDYVFSKYIIKNDYEYPLLPGSISRYFIRINKRHIFNKDIHPHMLRHTHASLMAEAKIPLETIQERLGHANDEITRKVYLHITEKEKQNAAKIFSEYMQKI